MKCVILLLVAVLNIEVGWTAERGHVDQFVTWVDHFNQQQIFQNNYFVSNLGLNRDGPLFVLVSGSFLDTNGAMEGSLMYDLAKELNGTVISVEQRYYGNSRPFPDLSYPNLQYLTNWQYVNDVNVLIHTIKLAHPMRNVVLFGNEYGGAIALWLKQLDPEVAKAVWVNNGFLYAKLDTPDYLESVGRTIKRASGVECYDSFENGFKAIENIISNGSDAEKAALTDDFASCNLWDVSNVKNVQLFFWLWAQRIINRLTWAAYENIERYCNMMTNNPGSDYEALSNLIIYLAEGECYDNDYEQFVNEIQNENYDTHSDWTNFRQNLYVQCTQFGWFITTNENQPFSSSIPLEFSIQLCQDVFGAHYSELSVRNATQYTDNLLRFISENTEDAIFSANSLNPHIDLARRSDISALHPFIYLSNERSDAIEQSISDTDSADLVKAKEAVVDFIKLKLGYN